MPYAQAEMMVEVLERKGIPHAYIAFEGEGHGFRKTANRTRSHGAIVRWFAQHLGRDQELGARDRY